MPSLLERPKGFATRRPHLLGPLLAMLIVSFVLSSTWSFVSPAVPQTPPTMAAVAQAETMEGFSLPSTVAVDAEVGGSGLWAGLFASAAGVAAAIAGIGRAKGPADKQR